MIDHVILYFRQAQLVERFIEDLRSGEFRALDAPRQIRMYRDYVDMLRYWKLLADDAVAALQKPRQPSAATNSSAWGRSAPKSASALAGASDRASSKSPPSNT
jgi:hypothetical protein